MAFGFALLIEVHIAASKQKQLFATPEKIGSLAVELCALFVTWNVALKSLLHDLQ